MKVRVIALTKGRAGSAKNRKLNLDFRALFLYTPRDRYIRGAENLKNGVIRAVGRKSEEEKEA